MVVTKSYQGPDASRRCAREAAVLSALAGRLPVPPVIDSGDTSLSLGFMPGVHGQEMIDGGLAEQVLHACGQMLRRIHAIGPSRAHVEDRHDEPAVLVHGDYGPNNVLLDAAAQEVIAVVDWEWAHAGDPGRGSSLVRVDHSHAPPRTCRCPQCVLDAYGHRPAWAARQQAMVAQCSALLAMSGRWQPSGQGVRLWRQRVQVTKSWTE